MQSWQGLFPNGNTQVAQPPFGISGKVFTPGSPLQLQVHTIVRRETTLFIAFRIFFPLRFDIKINM